MISDILWSLFTGLACVLAVFACLPTPRRKRSHLHLMMRDTTTPGAESSSEPSAESGTGKRPGFFHGQSTPENQKTLSREAMKYQSQWSNCPPISNGRDE